MTTAEITNISCKYISFLQDSGNFKSFLRNKNAERLAIEYSKKCEREEGQ
jgi:hypothetical protein